MASVVYTPANDITSQNPAGQANSLFFPAWPTGFEISNGADLSGVGQQTTIKFARQFGGVFTQTLRTGVTDEIHVDARSGAVIRFQAANTTAGASTANTIARLRVTGTAMVLDAGGGEVSDIQQTAGTVVMAGGTVIDSVAVMGGRFSAEYNATGLASLKLSKCQAVIRRPMAADSVCEVSDGADVLFARSQTIASSGISITGSDGILRITGNSRVNWQGGVIDQIQLVDAGSEFWWQDMYESVTLPLITGNADAIFKTGLRVGNNTSRFGATVAVTAITPLGYKVSEVGGWFPAP